MAVFSLGGWGGFCRRGFLHLFVAVVCLIFIFFWVVLGLGGHLASLCTPFVSLCGSVAFSFPHSFGALLLPHMCLRCWQI